MIISCWSQVNKKPWKPIQVPLKQALKVFDRTSLSYHHCYILSKHSLFSFENLILFSEVQLVFRIIHDASPPPLKSFFQLWSEQMSRTSRCALNSDLNIPLQRTTFAQSAFLFMAIKHWNMLPTELKTHTGFHSFSHGVKDWLLSNQSWQLIWQWFRFFNCTELFGWMCWYHIHWYVLVSVSVKLSVWRIQIFIQLNCIGWFC